MKIPEGEPDTLVLHQSDCIDDGRPWYGMVRYNGKVMGKHRKAWIEANGPIPDGAVVIHKCDNPSCYNVEHLMVGTQGDNMQDMISKGRRVKNYGARKLNEIQVRYIHDAWHDGIDQGTIAQRLGVHRNTVWRVINGRTYA